MNYKNKQFAIIEARYNREYRTKEWRENNKEKCKNELIELITVSGVSKERAEYIFNSVNFFSNQYIVKALSDIEKVLEFVVNLPK